ncbi:MAG: outer membrane beta-barrel protein [Vicinamibacterales bacterium]
MTSARCGGRTWMRGMAIGAVLAGVLTAGAEAQERPAPALDLSAGWIGFADDGIVSELAAGGAFRWHLTPRISVGPEITFIEGENHSHQVLTGNLIVDLRAPAPDGTPRVTPFVVIGGGVFRTSQSFSGRSFSSTEGAFTVGGGIRAPLSDRVELGVDARLGWEPHLRVAGVLGIRLGR